MTLLEWGILILAAMFICNIVATGMFGRITGVKSAAVLLSVGAIYCLICLARGDEEI
jgi:hypothetical protein|tara:strand:+ start:1736 stop:1906 length:171 start_codon:yes stop_codon:yes gene_type:complete